MLSFDKYNEVHVFSTNYGTASDIFSKIETYHPEMHYLEPDTPEWTYEQKVEFIKKLCLFGYCLRTIVYTCSANTKDLYIISGANEIRALAEFYNGELCLSGSIGPYDVHGLSYKTCAFAVQRMFTNAQMLYLSVGLYSGITMDELARELKDMLG